MSADNGVYILEAKDGFRVIHAQAIDNLWYWEYPNPHECSQLNPKYIKQYFGEAKIFKTIDEAYKAAKEIYDEIMSSDFPVIEYGISFIQGWEDKEFPK